MLAYGALVVGTVVTWNRGIVWLFSLTWAFALAFHRKAAVFRPLHMCLLASMDLREICKQVRVGRTSAIRQIVDLNANWQAMLVPRWTKCCAGHVVLIASPEWGIAMYLIDHFTMIPVVGGTWWNSTYQRNACSCRYHFRRNGRIHWHLSKLEVGSVTWMCKYGW